MSISPGSRLGPYQILAPTAGPLAVGIRSNYAVAPPDGKRFLTVTETAQAPPPSYTVVLNWQSELKK